MWVKKRITLTHYKQLAVPIALLSLNISEKQITPPLVWIDFETTGLSSQFNQIIEVGAIKRTPDGSEESFCELIQSKRKIPIAITKLTHISNQMLETQGKPIKEVMESLHKFIDHSILIAHNAAFDMRFLKKAFLTSNLPIPKNPVICTLKWIRETKETPPYNLGSLCEKYKITLTNAHRALADAKATKSLYDQLYKNHINELTILTFDQITQNSKQSKKRKSEEISK